MTLLVNGSGYLLFKGKYAELPEADWQIIWDETTKQPVLDGDNRPIFGVLDHPEYGLYALDPFQDTATRIVGH
jgi:hypothetical protein